MDLDYYRRRLAEAAASAKSAVEPCARIAHQKMAHAYARRIHHADPPPAIAPQDDVLGRWETDGGAPEQDLLPPRLSG